MDITVCRVFSFLCPFLLRTHVLVVRIITRKRTNHQYNNRKAAIIVGPKKKLYVASYPVEQRNEMALRVEAMFDIPCGTVPNFLNLTLTPSNQILHPGESESGAGPERCFDGVCCVRVAF